jgi:hypothetical protein
MAKHVSTKSVNNVSVENYDEGGSGTDKNCWLQVVTGKKKSLKKTKLSLYK